MVLWTDETKMVHWSQTEQGYVWRKKGKAFIENTLLTVKHGYGSIMLCGCVAVGGTQNIVRVERVMDSTKYQEILEANVRRSVQILKLMRGLGISARQGFKAYLTINQEVHPGKTDEGF